jgi:hypothetical protein
MKTTVELPDELLRNAKATAARRGVALRKLIEDAVERELSRGQSLIGQGRGWPVPPPKVPRSEIRRIQRLIDEEFETVDTEE